MSGKIRVALLADLRKIVEVDGSESSEREKIIRDAVNASSCHVYYREAILGYLILDYSFFDQGFISLCVVESSQRGQGIGTQLFKYAESICERKKLFSSTNRSNSGMRDLFLKLGYSESGMIENLDEGDPEVFYFKRIN